ncbi:uncharacterized protein LOC121180978 [Toxotes jaculatrix]|uniref:uncharacterized protein LOC121180978 n=1 Tax=Toxotes jaculatrix TaxID=941984 RepID=UPI001B3AC318|nr:uncharacterized protein LOC121180978 [Toxotes jaculatrix]
MPQNSMNFKGRRRGAHHNSCKANSLVNGQVPSTSVVNGPAAHSGCPATATRISEITPAGILNGTKPQCMVNGFINHGYKGKSTKAAPPRTLRKQGNTTSAVTDASAAGRVSSRDISGGSSLRGASSLDTVSLPSNSDKKEPEPSLSAAAKKTKRWKRFRRKKRNTEVVCGGNSTPLLPQEEEDWENEIQEVTLTNWEKMCFGIRPYGPEDVIHFALRDLTVQQRDAVDLPVTAKFSPAAYHPRPVRWVCYNISTEPGQFADADE